MQYRIQFLDAATAVISELIADARSARGAFALCGRSGLAAPRHHHARARRRGARGSFGEQVGPAAPVMSSPSPFAGRPQGLTYSHGDANLAGERDAREAGLWPGQWGLQSNSASLARPLAVRG